MDTSTSGGKLIFHVFGALAEFERNLIRERTNAGLSAARARGRNGGKRQKLDDQQRELALRVYNEGTSVKEICQTMGISKLTLYRYVRDGSKSLNRDRPMVALLITSSKNEWSGPTTGPDQVGKGAANPEIGVSA